jgi:molybdopterin molybdotransferase
MLTPAEAERAIAASTVPLPVEILPLAASCGRCLRETVRAERDQPPFDRVAMDGIAIASAAVAAGRRRFRIAGVAAAGSPEQRLDDPACALEAMTGAPLPAGADAVVPIERLRVAAGHAEIDADVAVEPSLNIHRRGADARAHDLLLEPGRALGPVELALAASAGRAELAVTRAPRIAILSTGDELVDPGRPIAAHQVRRSNPYALAAALAGRGHRDVVLRHAVDDRATLAAAIATELAARDVLLLSGGVSAGQFDFVPQALESCGVRRVFHKVAQRPGKPLWFGVGPAGQLVFGLPGNPVSALVCLARYVAPALDLLGGRTPPPPPQAALAAGVTFAARLAYFLPVRLAYDPSGRLLATPRPTGGSGDFVSLAGSDGFLELPPGPADFEPGAVAPVYYW